MTTAPDYTVTAAHRLSRLATATSRSLARIARTYEEYVSGRCDSARVLEVVRQETRRAAKTR